MCLDSASALFRKWGRAFNVADANDSRDARRSRENAIRHRDSVPWFLASPLQYPPTQADVESN